MTKDSDVSFQNSVFEQTAIWGPQCALADKDIATINATEQAIIIDAHNNYRRYVAKGLETRGNPGPQPGASNMRELVRKIKFYLRITRE